MLVSPSRSSRDPLLVSPRDLTTVLERHHHPCMTTKGSNFSRSSCHYKLIYPQRQQNCWFLSWRANFMILNYCCVDRPTNQRLWTFYIRTRRRLRDRSLQSTYAPRGLGLKVKAVVAILKGKKHPRLSTAHAERSLIQNQRTFGPTSLTCSNNRALEKIIKVSSIHPFAA